MAYREFAVLAVVPARGGSKSISRKNLARIGGRSLIEWAALAIAGSATIDAALLTTDDIEMAIEGRRSGLAVPFMRPAELAGDTVRAAPVWQHAWLAGEAHFARRFQVSVLIEPTSPLRRAEDIDAVVARLVDGGHESAATVSRTPSHHAPEKQLVMGDRGEVRFHVADGARYTVRQNIPIYYHRNGLCYAARRDTVVDRCIIFENDCGAVVTARPVVDINEPLDLVLSEVLMRRDDVLSGLMRP